MGSMVKRVFLFGLVNILIIVMLSLVLSLLGVRPYLSEVGIDYESLMIFCLVWGMGGAFISLALSRTMAKWMMGVQVIDPNTTNPKMRELVQRVHMLAKKANLSVMPEVGIYESPEINAFATGPTRNRALVAVSTGLMHRMNDAEIEGVLGHEVAHIANGDMVTMTLIQGVINAFVMFFARIAAFAVSQLLRGNNDDRGGGLGYFGHVVTVMLFEIVFGLLGSIVVAYFSRFREFRADQGGAQLAGRHKMIAALEALKANSRIEVEEESSQATLAAFKISGKKPSGLLALLATHPPLELRIERLKKFQGA